MVRRMLSVINQNKLMGMLFLDVAKAFNCIDHNTLYRKLRDISMSDRIVDWFRSYLDRNQIVRYGDCDSSKMHIPAGIAQGMVLGPIIFIFYNNDCKSCVMHILLCLQMIVFSTILEITGMLCITNYKRT